MLKDGNGGKYQQKKVDKHNSFIFDQIKKSFAKHFILLLLFVREFTREIC